MIFRKGKEVVAVECPKGAFTSARYLTQADKVGFTVTKTVVKAGGVYRWHYANHVEACLCVSGNAIVTDSEGKQHWLNEWDMYAPNDHKPHTFEALDGDCVLVCVFTPALKGNEVHNDRGQYEL